VNLLMRKYRLENEVDKDGEPEPVNWISNSENTYH
jgi:hypothetical protein